MAVNSRNIGDPQNFGLQFTLPKFSGKLNPMQKLILLAVFMLGGMWGKAQNIEDDAVLSGLKEILPGDWKMEFRSENLVIEKKDSVWVLFGANLRKAQNGQEPDLASAPKTVSRIVFHYEPRWDGAKKEKVAAKNAELDAEIAALEKKHGVEHLRKESRGRVIYVPRMDGDKEKITDFKMAETEIRMNKQQLPDYNTAKYSLFRVSATGMNSKYEGVHPPAAAQETQKILDYFDKNAK